MLKVYHAIAAVVLALAAAIGGAGRGATATRTVPAGSVPTAASFRDFLESLWPEAQARGVSRALFDASFAELTPDASVAAMIRRQPEELKSIGSYLASQVTPSRVTTGRAMLERWRTDLDAIERRYGVPAAIIVAVWGIETNYGVSTGNKDVIRSLATLASVNYRPELYRGELLSGLGMLSRGDVDRHDLRGSWAGAMGLPQFMPSSFERYAVDQDGDGKRDIWHSVPDALASIANFLRTRGWHPGRPWGFEVTLPPRFDFHTSRASFKDWQSLGVTRPGGAPMPDGQDGILFLPAGAKGPAFLVTENYEILKTYNFSDTYVLSVGQLADQMEGGPPIAAAWPSEPPMGRNDRIALQARLAELGYAVDNRQGRISLALRDVIRVAQARVNMVPDGNPSSRLLHALPPGPEPK